MVRLGLAVVLMSGCANQWNEHSCLSSIGRMEENTDVMCAQKYQGEGGKERCMEVRAEAVMLATDAYMKEDYDVCRSAFSEWKKTTTPSPAGTYT